MNLARLVVDEVNNTIIASDLILFLVCDGSKVTVTTHVNVMFVNETNILTICIAYTVKSIRIFLTPSNNVISNHLTNCLEGTYGYIMHSNIMFLYILRSYNGYSIFPLKYTARFPSQNAHMETYSLNCQPV